MSTSAAVKAGIENLLLNCIQANPGESLTIVSEQGHGGYYSATLDSTIAAHARECLLDARIVVAPVLEDASTFPADIASAIDTTDHTLFLARIGDQVRFTQLGGSATKTMCYALDEHAFGTPFCSAHYQFFLSLKSLINTAVFGEKEIVITCPAGTHLVGTSPVDPGDDDTGDVTVRRFPMTVFRPVPGDTFSGRLAVTKWLCPTGSRMYQPDSALIDGVVFALVENGRIVDFEGENREVRKIRDHYQFVAEKFDLDGDVIHSWHAGFHPQNGYAGLAVDDLPRWSGSAFGNPRYLHLHTCGNYPPGEICISVFDSTISVDGVDMWRDGRLVFADTQPVQALMNNYPGMRELFEKPVMEFGLGDALIAE